MNPNQFHHCELNFNYGLNQDKKKKDKPHTPFGRKRNKEDLNINDDDKRVLKKSEVIKKKVIVNSKNDNIHDKKKEEIKESPNINKINMINEQNIDKNIDKNIERNIDKNIEIDNEKNKVTAQNEEKKIQKDNKDEESYYINSINKIRLPKFFYDISYDIIQYE